MRSDLHKRGRGRRVPAHCDHRRRRHRPGGASAGVSRAGIAGRRAVRRAQRRRAIDGRRVCDRHGVPDARRGGGVAGAHLRSRGPRRPDPRDPRRSFPAAPAVLIQKPMGPDLAAAHAIRECCRDRDLTAAVNLPAALQPERARAAGSADARRARRRRGHRGPHRDRPAAGTSGRFSRRRRASKSRITRSTISTRSAGSSASRRLRALQVRSGIRRSPASPTRAVRSSSTTAISCAARSTLNHTHRAGPRYRASEMMVEGLNGAARLTWGVNLELSGRAAGHDGDRPRRRMDGGVRCGLVVHPTGSQGRCRTCSAFVSGEDRALVSPVDDAIRTMAVVEACYTSSASGGTPIPST